MQPGGDVQDFQTSPGYQWQLGQGLRAVDAGAASSGLLRSGATLKAEQTFGSGFGGSRSSRNYYNPAVFDLSKVGETAAAGTGAARYRDGHGDRADRSQARAAGCPVFTATRRAGWATRSTITQNQSLYQSRTNALMPGGREPACLY